MVANRIKEERLKIGKSIYDMANETKLTPGYISNLERGERNNPSKETMEAIAKALGKTVVEVFYPEH
ncbi:helix-turn-helix transcriptional regulator [Tissierella praeacuta]|uniref:helix-turn-helix domain-containing protein n=1 Tax=Tissierella praeacuta TaxID=43131 RepID=UPI0035160AE3